MTDNPLFTCYHRGAGAPFPADWKYIDSSIIECVPTQAPTMVPTSAPTALPTQISSSQSGAISSAYIAAIVALVVVFMQSFQRWSHVSQLVQR